MPQLRPRLIASTRLRKACNRRQIRSLQPRMVPAHSKGTRIKARGKTGRARHSRGKVRDKVRTRVRVKVRTRVKGKGKVRDRGKEVVVEEKGIGLAASLDRTSRSLCQGKLALAAAHKAMMATMGSSRTAVLSLTRRSLHSTTKWHMMLLTIAIYHLTLKISSTATSIH